MATFVGCHGSPFRNHGGCNSHNKRGHNSKKRQLYPAKEGHKPSGVLQMQEDGAHATVCPGKKDCPAAKSNPFQKGHVNHMNAEELFEDPDAVMG